MTPDMSLLSPSREARRAHHQARQRDKTCPNCGRKPSEIVDGDPKCIMCKLIEDMVEIRGNTPQNQSIIRKEMKVAKARANKMNGKMRRHWRKLDKATTIKDDEELAGLMAKM
ncbi:hypothetical protein ACHAQH_006753 [Verticillium albo-atrum]